MAEKTFNVLCNDIFVAGIATEGENEEITIATWDVQFLPEHLKTEASVGVGETLWSTQIVCANLWKSMRGMP